jgi:hypothetical protein
MTVGAGKYRSEAEALLTMYRAEAVVVCVIGGVRGTGFSLAQSDEVVMQELPGALRIIAEQIEAEVHSDDG